MTVPVRDGVRIPGWALAVGGVLLTVAIIVATGTATFAFDTTSRLARLETLIVASRTNETEARQALLDVIRVLSLRVDRLETRVDSIHLSKPEKPAP